MLDIESQNKIIINEEYSDVDRSNNNNNERLKRKELNRIKTKKIDNHYNFDEDEDISKFDVPCPLAQQGIAVLMGILCGYITLLLSKDNYLYVSLATSIGTSFGMLAAAVPLPWLIHPKELLVLITITLPVSYIMLSLFDLSLVGIIFNSIILGSIMSALKIILLSIGVFQIDIKKITC